MWCPIPKLPISFMVTQLRLLQNPVRQPYYKWVNISLSIFRVSQGSGLTVATVTGPSAEHFFLFGGFRSSTSVPGQNTRKPVLFQKTAWWTRIAFWPTLLLLSVRSHQYLLSNSVIEFMSKRFTFEHAYKKTTWIYSWSNRRHNVSGDEIWNSNWKKAASRTT